MPLRYTEVIVKFNGGKGALLCNRCHNIIAVGLDHEDVQHLCENCGRCKKGMTKDTCLYNPLLGCDCGLNPPPEDHSNICRCEICRFWS